MRAEVAGSSPVIPMLPGRSRITGGVAQLAREMAFEAICRRFESCRPCEDDFVTALFYVLINKSSKAGQRIEAKGYAL